MKTLLSLALALLLSTSLRAQNNNASGSGASSASPGTTLVKGNGKISGVVLDAGNQKPVAFATVSLINSATNKVVDGTITDDRGKFTIERVAPGQYTVAVSFISYETKTSSLLNIVGNKDEVVVGVIALKQNTKALKEVNITGEKPLIEDKVDRMVYNAEKDITNIGGTAGDVLKKVPGLTVDLEGNVQLRGSSNIRVLINNKPSSIMAASIADALRQIPAEQIKTVEVITSPSAKYDAEGTGGIINIVTKKNNLQGLTGNTNLSYGTRNSNAGGSINYRQGKYGINTSFGTNQNNNPGQFTSETFYLNNPAVNRATQFGTGRRVGTFNYIQVGLDYDFNKKNTLSAGIRLNDPNFTFKTSQLSTIYTDASTSSFERVNRNQFKGSNYDLNFDYTKTFAKPQQELTFLGLYSKFNRDNLIDINQFNESSLPTLQENNFNEADNEEITFQADYVHPFTENQTLEVGTKAIIRNVSSNIQYSVLKEDGQFGPNVNAPNEQFIYNQDVLATYASFGFSLNKKYSFKVGSRFEYTAVDAQFLQNQLNLPEYQNFIPSLSISRDLKKNQKLKFNYTRRIQRPQLFYLNPYINRADSLNQQVGNPNLDAELTNSYEFSYSTFFKSSSINASVYWRQTNNSIQSYQESVNRVVYTYFGNIGRNGNYGFSLFGNSKFLQKGNVSGNLNVYYMHLNSPTLKVDNGSLMYNTNLNASWNFEKGLSAQVFGFFNSPRLTLQGRSGSWTYYNFALKKELFKKKGSISAGVDNPFAKTIRLKTYAQTSTVDFTNILRVYNRQLRASFNYQFGKTTADAQPRRKKKINNDDAKSGGDNNGQ